MCKDLREKDEHGREKFVKDYGVENLDTVSLVLRVHGGSASNVSGNDLPLATERDFITLEDTPVGQSWKMPCGHVLGPDSLKSICKTVLAAGGYEFRCSYKEGANSKFCNMQWDFSTVKRMALLTNTEIKDFKKKIAYNYRKACGIKECPKCKSFCSRKRNTDQRVICPNCTRNDRKNYEFCWFCLKIWMSSGVSECGNSGCFGKDARLEVLKNSETKEVVGVKCPKLRACPTCGVFIEHIEKCKHMSCPCGTKFCFICLKKSDVNGSYTCGSYNTKCEVAPVQTEIPTL
ncbi:uncharacterized protein LOC127839068 isoform X2 [Dreissena polymorpha]|nr:uncharacterized protein LOC127839068 isoform X2 [Dreissena polymorpha]